MWNAVCNPFLECKKHETGWHSSSTLWGAWRTCHEWFNGKRRVGHFNEGRENVHDDPRSGCWLPLIKHHTTKINGSIWWRRVAIFISQLLQAQRNILQYQLQDSTVGTTSYRLDEQGVGVWVLGGGQEFSLLHVVQTGSGVHPASYSMGTVGSFPEGKAAGAWSWPLTFN
jgi:hypothetical protein